MYVFMRFALLKVKISLKFKKSISILIIFSFICKENDNMYIETYTHTQKKKKIRGFDRVYVLKFGTCKVLTNKCGNFPYFLFAFYLF